MSSIHSRTTCPLCDSAEHEVDRLLTHKGRPYTVVVCKECTFVFVREIYGSTESHGRQPNKPTPKARHHQIRQLVAGHRPGAPKQVVEVGAGWGGLASLLNGMPQVRYAGFEPSGDRAEFCRSHGLEVRNEMFMGRASAAEVDVVVLDNVLEHVSEPLSLLRQCREVLKPDGMAIVIVPNLRDIRRFHPAWRDRHLWQPHCHINYFTDSTLRDALRRAAFAANYFPVGLLRAKGSLAFGPRLLLDTIGVHVMGLNVVARTTS